MDDNTTAFLIVGIVFAGIIVLRAMKLKARDGRTLNQAERAQLEDMGRMAGALEARVNTLERILDDQVPAWRAGDYAGTPRGYGGRG